MIGRSKQSCHPLLAVSRYSSETVDNKGILRTVPGEGIYCSSDKDGTAHLV
jgi:hypothetical protein